MKEPEDTCGRVRPGFTMSSDSLQDNRNLTKLRRLINTVSKRTFSKDISSEIETLASHEHFYGMNRQFIRARIILELISALPVDAFIETGTFRGETSLLIAAQTSLPVFSCDINPDFCKHARLRVLPFGKRVKINQADSREFLEKLLSEKAFECPLFYLDAHWYEDLPLYKELLIITGSVKSFVIVVDDFKVPSDQGFGFDTYGKVSLEWETIKSAFGDRKVDVFYPSYPSSKETGFITGWAVIVPSELADKISDAIPGSLLHREVQQSGSS